MSSFFEKLMLSFVFLNKKSRLFQFCWTFGFLSWILGCYFWVINSEPVSSIFVIVSIIFCLLGLFKIRDFRKNKPDISSKENFDFGIYIVLIVISVLTMVLSKSIANGITGIISLFIVWQAYKINKAMRDQWLFPMCYPQIMYTPNQFKLYKQTNKTQLKINKGKAYCKFTSSGLSKNQSSFS